jgi:hypothetical protein
MNYSYYWDGIGEEGDGDAEHGEEMGIVDCPVQRIDAPCWRRGDEIIFSAAGGVGLFAYKSDKSLAYFPDE